MNKTKILAVLQIILAGLLFLASLVTVINFLFIVFRPETISVVNALIGQGVIVICMMALARILLKKGRSGLTGTNDADASSGS